MVLKQARFSTVYQCCVSSLALWWPYSLRPFELHQTIGGHRIEYCTKERHSARLSYLHEDQKFFWILKVKDWKGVTGWWRCKWLRHRTQRTAIEEAHFTTHCSRTEEVWQAICFLFNFKFWLIRLLWADHQPPAAPWIYVSRPTVALPENGGYLEVTVTAAAGPLARFPCPLGCARVCGQI